MTMPGLKVTAEKGKGSSPQVRHSTSKGQTIPVPGQGAKKPGLSEQAARALGGKRK